ncbi:thermonuclease family protein [Granulosicoccus antarcticus]|uniref:thermonuclease family protein n=1 Tax=Granulosicoccus antarcticus TaxID=437505 RepID=UPI00197AF6C0|nr:thermonuclease family protein [Granulosicoccus antarcticus]
MAAADNLPQLTSCLEQAQTEKVTIARVTDGDTVVLDDQRRVRLIGLNTLELNSPDKQDRLMAQHAKEALENFLENTQALIISGKDAHDRYGRLLAHLRRADGQDAAQTLIATGMGLAVAVGRNTRCADTLHTLELQARDAGLGIWQSPGSWQLNSSPLTGRERGFHVATGHVQEIQGHKGKTKLILDNGLQVKLGSLWPKSGELAASELSKLIGQEIQVRGWLGTSAGKQSLTLNHPSNLELTNNS